MPQYFSALPSPLTPPGKKSQTTSCTEFSALSPALLDRRATQKPLPEKVSPLTRLAVSNASPRKARKFLNDNYLERKHQYHHGGQLSYDYVKPLEHARSPKLKIGKETEGEVNKAELKTIEDMAARKLDMTKTSLVAEINEKREMLKVKNAEWAEKVSRVHESKEMFKMVKRRNAEWAEKASRLREARRVRENTDVKSDLSENATTSSPNTQSSTPGPKVLASAPVIPVKSRSGFDAFKPTSAPSPVRQRAPSGTRIPLRAPTWTPNVVPDFAHAQTLHLLKDRTPMPSKLPRALSQHLEVTSRWYNSLNKRNDDGSD